ncbi:MAG: ATP12 family protein [Sphingomonadales bacterium]
MKRFYKAVTVEAQDAGFAVLLDGRTVKTPGRAVLTLPTGALADAVAGEWDVQDDAITPDTMPLTRHANTAIDRIAGQREPVIGEIVSFAATDTICYRADYPPELTEREAEAWQPVLVWLREAYGAALVTASGIIHQPQPDDALDRLRGVVSDYDEFRLAALHTLTTVSGSLALALAVAGGRTPAAEAFELSQIDETFQAERWGLDSQAQVRRDRLRGEMIAAGRFLDLLG